MPGSVLGTECALSSIEVGGVDGARGAFCEREVVDFVFRTVLAQFANVFEVAGENALDTLVPVEVEGRVDADTLLLLGVVTATWTAGLAGESGLVVKL